jgi:hypothetical protein
VFLIATIVSGFYADPKHGVRAVLVHAKNTKVRDWYKKQAGFIESPTDSLHLFLLIQEIEKNLKPI